MPRKIYTADHHRIAFETWYETRNMSAASKAIDSNYLTPRRWRKATFICVYNCPYHGWDRLMDERDAALQVRHDLIQQGVVDPVKHDLAMRAAISEPGPKAENPHVLKIIRSDLERMAHWEYLYCKTYFDLTGIALEYGSIKEGETREQFRKGLHVTNAEAGIRMLKVIQDQIDALQGADRSSLSTSTEQRKREQITLTQLRKMRELAKNTPPHKLKTMLTVMEADGAKQTTASAS